MPNNQLTLAERLSITRWLGATLGRYVVWDANSLLVPANDKIGRAGEQLIYSERRHLVQLFVSSWAPMLISTFGPLLLLRVDGRVAQLLIALVILGAQGRLLWNVIEWAITCIMIPDLRIIVFGGFLRRNGGSMPLSKVTDLNYEQSFVGLLFDYGSVRVESAGQDQALDEIDYLRYPVVFQQELVARTA